MREIKVLILISLALTGANDSFAQSIRYDGLGKLPTKDSAILFAPELISSPDRYERVVTFNPNGKELYFSITEKGWLNQKIFVSNYIEGKWQEPKIANFSENISCTEPFISPDGQKLFFISNRPPGSGWDYDIWFLQKCDSGWCSPVRLDDNVNSKAGDWHPSVSNSGDLYFASLRKGGMGKADLYFSKFENDKYLKYENLGSIVNTEHYEWDPFISPDNKYLIFKSNRPGGYGDFDMYISLNVDNKWTMPKNLGSIINSPIEDDAGDVTPDGKYLIFSRINEWEFVDIYWIKIDVINEFLN